MWGCSFTFPRIRCINIHRLRFMHHRCLQQAFKKNTFLIDLELTALPLPTGFGRFGFSGRLVSSTCIISSSSLCETRLQAILLFPQDLHRTEPRNVMQGIPRAAHLTQGGLLIFSDNSLLSESVVVGRVIAGALGCELDRFFCFDVGAVDVS